MNDDDHKDEERLSRQQAAERLVDIAYALTAGGELELNTAGRRIRAPLAPELRLERRLRFKDERVELELELTWSIPDAHAADGLRVAGPDDAPASAVDRARSD